ncbi:MAG: RluA family pseudouridine synthase [Candidatus Brocadiaceae bacterium]|nr:RluA family pseudouridine synthase [Candidatus Brocadiaceae bacterium]
MVFVNKRRTWIASYQLNGGDLVEIVNEAVQTEKFQDNTVLYQDDYYLIVSKPPGIVTNGENSLETKLRIYPGYRNLQAVHRLDKNTTGAVLFAKNEEAFHHMKSLFKKQLVKKVYRAIVKGRVKKDTLTLNSPVRGLKAASHIKTLKKGLGVSYIEIEIETGRLHQIRIHLASVGHPIIGETEYDRKPIMNSVLRQINRQMLHAYHISFPHPYIQKLLTITADIPADFKQYLKLLGLEE